VNLNKFVNNTHSRHNPGHNCVATATAGYAQGRCQDFTLVATEAKPMRRCQMSDINIGLTLVVRSWQAFGGCGRWINR